MATFSGARGSLLAGVLAGIGASACCVGPLVLLGLGIGGAWVGTLTALEPYRPALIGLTAVFIGLAFRALYLVPEACEPGRACADPRVLKRQRIVFWAVSLPLLALVATPYVAPLFY